jgi:predicted AAA+ superfamily ATPase
MIVRRLSRRRLPPQRRPKVRGIYRSADQLQRRAVRLKGPNILIFPGFAACGAKAAPVWERPNESAPMAKSKSKPKPKSAAQPTSGAPDAQTLTRIADALERLAPRPNSNSDFDSADAFIWQAKGSRLVPVPRVNRVQMTLLKGIDRVRDTLMENTERFAKGLPALMDLLRRSDFRFIVFCDDLSFDGDDASYKSLKAVLEGGIEGRPDNVILYATSNRRHLLAREMIENERSTAINPGEAVEEKVSLSDRFGLWLGFHRCSQDEYLAMVKGYCNHFGIKLADGDLEREALEWSTTRGSRSGRVAWQFTQELAGRLGVRLTGK